MVPPKQLGGFPQKNLDIKREHPSVVIVGAAMASDGLLRCVFEGCIATYDMEIERRPYHRNCGCALHNTRGCTKASNCDTKISYPIRRAWSKSCLVMACSPSPSSSSPSSTSLRLERTHEVLCKKEESVLWET
ncbi:hypothetical protein CKAN_00391700 [Cinnamomum micranthum f. kanehirae]|uniref:Uncharacterized protein n=1 Tax=Cinnamomum micranthum f. kanehirae TaxID=337451 RepID=A0A3S3MKV8_9MAGN|nr:hypothetical protein CKAN_00391700 [Cinnamomum micranthum f. kanehirae]